MKRLLFIINTYNRPKEVCNLLTQIKDQSKGLDITINLYDDGSQEYQSQLIQLHVIFLLDINFKINYTKFIRPHKKYLYWRLVCKNFHHGIRDCEDYDYYFMLPDDAILTKNYIYDAIAQWEAIEDDKKICLNTCNLDGRGGQSCWTNFTPVLKQFGKIKYWLCGWIDMEFICKKQFFVELDYRVKAPHKNWWTINPNRSSGVGMYISYRLFRKGFHLYQVEQSLTKQIKHKSVMQTTI